MTMTAAAPHRAVADDGATARQGRNRYIEIRIGPFGGTIAVLLVALGLLVIGLGWNGAAGSGSYVNGVPDIRAQLPWLISGGGLGIALVIVGAALMVTQAHRTDRARLEARIEELAEALRTGGGALPAIETSGPASSASSAPSASSKAGGTAVAERNELVVAGATSYHRPACRLAKGRGVRPVTVAEAESEGLKPCRICHPEE